jgi:hypothetical protein
VAAPHGVLYLFSLAAVPLRHSHPHFTSTPCLYRQHHHLFGLTAAPLWQYQMGQSLNSAAPSGIGKLFWCPFSLDHCRPSSRASWQTNLHCTTPILHLCCPSLGYQGKNRTTLGPIFFSFHFHAHFALLSQHSLQAFHQASSFGCEHNASSLPLGKMLLYFDLIGRSSRLLLLSMLVMLFLQHRVINSIHVLFDAHSLG